MLQRYFFISVRPNQCVVLEMYRKSMKNKQLCALQYLILDMVVLVGTSHNLNRELLYLSNAIVCDYVIDVTLATWSVRFVGLSLSALCSKLLAQLHSSCIQSLAKITIFSNDFKTTEQQRGSTRERRHREMKCGIKIFFFLEIVKGKKMYVSLRG
jgi:hypothetical protein